MGNLLINLLLAIIPALVLVFYFYRRDSQKKEPGTSDMEGLCPRFFLRIPGNHN